MWIANSLASYFQFCHNEVLPRLRSGGHPLQFYQSEVSNEWVCLFTSSNLHQLLSLSITIPEALYTLDFLTACLHLLTILY